jgi:predicted acetyltransferase
MVIVRVISDAVAVAEAIQAVMVAVVGVVGVIKSNKFCYNSPKKVQVNPMKITPVSETNSPIYHNLVQCYEAEFSSLTGKKPNGSGLFELDTHLGENILGLLLIIDNTPAGIAAIHCKEGHAYEVCEFYVVPYFRKNGIGMEFAHAIWESYPGDWEIKQIRGAEYATAFWRKTINSFNETEFTEESYDDPYWGSVTRQKFTIN